MAKKGRPEETNSVLAAALAVLGFTSEDVWAWADREEYVAVVLLDGRKFKVIK